jgi:hypothetical protein
MDGRSFDRLARLFGAAGSRRDALRAALGVALFGISPSLSHGKDRDEAGKRRNSRGKSGDRRRESDKGLGQRRKRGRVRAQALRGGCCSSGNCAPGAGRNLAKCCYQVQNLSGQNFKGANLGGANFSGATLINANFSSANLDKTCFVGANLRGARMAGTNTGTVIFCRTTMPDGSTNDSGCGKGTDCCPTCEGPCPSGQRCCGNGTCAECCSDGHCADGLSCNGGVCGECVPDCANRECGPDSCGATCGDGCTVPYTCNNRTGRCVCQPDCDDKSCGPDGCGGVCEPGCSEAVPACTSDGQCVACVVPGDCPDPGPCRTRACVNNTCQPQVAENSTNPRNACPGAEVCCSGACANCCVSGDCTPPANGSATCSQGRCQRFCDNNLHRICGDGAGVCQECCNENQCSTIGGDCVNGTCQCPGANESRCGMECINLSIEPNNCGACGVECASGTCVNGRCREPEPCGSTCPPQIPECEPEPEFCPGDKECTGPILDGICTCPDDMVDCDGDGFCEACGRCGVTACADDPETGEPGFCCPGGYCSCGGECCAGPECWVTTIEDGEGTPIGRREQCDNTSGCVDCWGQCCTACINGNCASSGPISGGSIRRR